jgi:hypothetical protein
MVMDYEILSRYAERLNGLGIAPRQPGEFPYAWSKEELMNFGKRGAARAELREVPKLEIPEHLRQGPDDLNQQIARVAQEIRESKARGDAAVEQARRPAFELPPTAAGVFATNALDIMRKREEVLDAAIMRAEELGQLAQEMLACGTRVQDFLLHTQNVTAAVVEARATAAIATPAPAPAQASPAEEAPDAPSA